MAIDTSSNPSLNEIVSSLAARVNKQHDVAFMDELKHIVNYKRSAALYAWMLKLTLRDYLFQDVFMETERVPSTDPCQELFPTDCYVVKTKCQVPDPFRDPRATMSYQIFEYVGHVSGYMPYGYITMETLSYLKYKPYTSKAKKWFYSGGYIYIINDKQDPSESIRVRGVFQGVIDDVTCDVCNPDGTTCSPNSAPYPVPPELLDTIIQSVLRDELKVGDVPKEVDEEKDTIKVDTTEQVQHLNT
jgi:hypothetical protein